MATFVLEEVDQKVHMIREALRDKKGRRIIHTKCGADIEREDAIASAWDSDVTCPACAVPWV